MNSILRKILVPSLAALGVLVALPSVASADPIVVRGPHVRVSQERDRDHARFERERFERERSERVRFERERIEHARLEREREHQLVCVRAYDSGAPAWRLREMGCYVR